MEKLSKHGSQTDAAKGFGGKYGVQQDRVDKAAVGWDHKENLQKHASQKGMSRQIFACFIGTYKFSS